MTGIRGWLAIAGLVALALVGTVVQPSVASIDNVWSTSPSPRLVSGRSSHASRSSAQAILDSIDSTSSSKAVNANVKIPTPETHWIEQPVDHFNARDKRKWKQRFLVTTEMWKPNKTTNLSGPIFVYTGGEAEITHYWNTAGFVYELARDFGALVVMAEHRYYGQSWPFGTAKDSLTQDNIGYLSSIQALSDYAALIYHVFDEWKVTPDTPVLTIGGSYAGMMAAWMRLRYAHIVDAAYASSAPILIAGQGYPHPYISPYSYFARVAQDYQAADLSCPINIRAGFTALLAAFNSGSQSALEQVKTDLNLCNTPSSSDADFLVQWARQAYVSLAQSDYAYANGNWPAWPVDAACATLKSIVRTGGALKGMGAVMAMAYGDGSNSCLDPTKLFRPCADQTGCGFGDDADAWDYQACTEIVYFMSSNNKTDVFPPSQWTLDTLTQYCKDRWDVIPNPDFIGIEFGGKDITDSFHLIFTNGELDPWAVGGVQFDLGPEIVALNYEKGAHHADLNTPSTGDPDSVRTVRDKVKKHIQQYLFHTRP